MKQRVYSSVSFGLLASLVSRSALNLAIRSFGPIGGLAGVIVAFAVAVGTAALGGYVAVRLAGESGLREAFLVGIGLVMAQVALGLILPGLVDLGWGLALIATIVIPAALLGGYSAVAGLTSAST